MQSQGRALGKSCSRQPSCIDMRAKTRRGKRCEAGFHSVLCVVASAQFCPLGEGEASLGGLPMEEEPTESGWDSQ